MLQETERGLRHLLQEEVACGRYSNLPALASIADGVSDLITRTEELIPDKAVEGEAAAPQAADSQEAKLKSKTSPIAKKTTAVQSNKKRKTSKYPSYEIGDDWIGKVGWSKRNRKEYRHYASISAAIALAKHIDKTQQPGHVWTVDDLGDVIDSETDEVLPSYQIYLIIGWMRFTDLVLKQGRSGYVAVGGRELTPSVDKVLRVH